MTTFSKILEPRFVAFQFKFNGRNSSVKVGKEMSAAVAPIKNPVTGEPESVRIEHGTGFIFKAAECVSAEEMKVSAGELNFSWPQKAAFVTKVFWSCWRKLRLGACKWAAWPEWGWRSGDYG